MDNAPGAQAPQQPWHSSEDYFNATFQDRLAAIIGRSVMEAQAADIRANMANARAAALADDVAGLADEVDLLKGIVEERDPAVGGKEPGQ